MTDHETMAMEIVQRIFDNPREWQAERCLREVASALRQVAQEKERETLERAAKVCEERAEQLSKWTRNQKRLSGRDLAIARGKYEALRGMASIIRGEDIWDSPTPTEDLSTPGELIDREYVRVPRDAIVATSVEADFEKGTWTFEPKGEWSVCAGDYYLIPVRKYEQTNHEG